MAPAIIEASRVLLQASSILEGLSSLDDQK